MPKDREIAAIYESFIREAFENDEVELTPELLEEIEDRIVNNLFWFLQDQISEARSYIDILERNKLARFYKPHYLVKWRNPNAYQAEFQTTAAFKTEEDAQEYIHYQNHQPFDEWKVERVEL